ncbi:MAG: hypothetical protein ABL930_13880, partial [Pseudobdellovibrio sp.]
MLTRYFFKSFIYLSLLLISGAAIAAPLNLEQILIEAQTKKLHQSVFWHKLLNYKSTLTGSVKSDIQNADYFLSTVGNINPESELIATIKAITVANFEDDNQNAQCKFIARYNWLSRELNLSQYDFHKANCTQFKEWTQNNSVKSLSAVFASGYLG